MARIAGSDSTKTKALICEKALGLAAQTGFDALTMRALAAACNLQVAAIYHYFPDKQSLLASLLTTHFDRLLNAANALPAQPTATARLLSFARFHIVFHATHKPEALLAQQELRSLTRGNADVILPKRHSYERVLRRILVDGMADNSFAIPDPNLSCAAMLAMLSEIAVWYRAGGKATLDETSNAYALAALKMVTP
jgi:AcrR family transcriptional regulator